jgi:hypothetical protein
MKASKPTWEKGNQPDKPSSHQIADSLQDIILLDPPFKQDLACHPEMSNAVGQNSKYRWFLSRPMPRSGPPHDHDAAIAAAEIKKDLAQIQKLIESNSKRVTESVDLITVIMSVREGETSIDQTRGLGFLTVIATIFLPFNTVTAILSMQTDFQPGKWRFWLLVAISASIYLCIWLAYIAYQLGARYHKRGNTRTMTSH